MPFGINKVALFGVAGAVTDSAILIQSQTTASAASIEFTTGITSAYKQYVFSFYGVAPIVNTEILQMAASTNGGTSYGVTTTSTFFKSYQTIIWDTTGALLYEGSRDLAQSTNPQTFAENMANSSQSAGGNNTPGAHLAGEFILYNPASTTYVKHFHSKFSYNFYLAAEQNPFVAGYYNTTSAINAVKFNMVGGGNIEGTIKMWGIK
ncbi:MAG: hypothetical protein GY893_00185 [bacterium]|nr:hypothetical protein [bacterium]